MMKKLLSFLMIGTCAVIAAQNANAQSGGPACTPDPQFAGDPGIYPDSAMGYLPDACADQAYAQTITVVLPTDTLVDFPGVGLITLTMNYIKVDSAKIIMDGIGGIDTSGVPSDINFSFACSPLNCTFPGGQSGCLQLDGSPTSANIGVWPLIVYVTPNVTHALLGTFDAPQSIISNYIITIGPIAPPTPVFTQSTTDSTTAFTTENSQAYDSFEWNFGDGTTSTLANPTHTYATHDSTFTVELVACASSCNQTLCDSSSQDVVIFVGIEERADLARLSLFPNPSSGQFNLSLDATSANELQINAFNTVGQLVYSEIAGKVNGRITKTLNLEHLSAGVYSLQVRLGNEEINKKIIIAGK